MLRNGLLFILVASTVTLSAAPVPQTPATQPPVAKEEAPLSNKDVVKLAKLGLGDEVVIAKVKQATSVTFDVTTDGLVQLKQAGVSGPIIAAMLEKTTPRVLPRADTQTTIARQTRSTSVRTYGW